MNWYRNLKISRQLIAGFLTIAFIASIVGIIGLFNMVEMMKSDKNMYDQALVLEYSSSASVNFQEYSHYITKLAVLTSSIDIQNDMMQMEQYKTGSSDNLNNLSNVIGQKDKEILNKINSSWKDYQSNMDAASLSITSGDIDSAKSIINNQLEMIGVNLKNNYNQLLKQVTDDIATRSTINNKQAQEANLLMIGVILLGVISSIALGIIISRAISRPLIKLTQVADLLALGNINSEGIMDEEVYRLKSRHNEIGKLICSFYSLIDGIKAQVTAVQIVAAGNLTNELKTRSDDDILGKSLAILSKKLNELIIGIITSAEQVTSGATIVSDSSLALSQGTTEQSNIIMQLTDDLLNVANQTNSNEQKAEKVNSLANNATIQASKGNNQMQELLAAMNDIDNASIKIKKVIKVIDDIAFQTNILALNAAVEAARAGQHGKGFAIVAKEVRALATRSANAVKETTELVESSIQKVKVGTGIANITADILKEILIQINDVASLVDFIAKASKEQTVSIEHINNGIHQVSKVLQTTVLTSEESANVSKELFKQAAKLQEGVNFFEVDAKIQNEDNISKNDDCLLLFEKYISKEVINF